MTAAALGPRQAAVLEHLRQHPGLTAGELGRHFGLRHSLMNLLRGLEQKARVVAVTSHEPAQGRPVSSWYIAPPGTVPPPPPAVDPQKARRQREAARLSQRARRARAVTESLSLPDLLAAACRTADPDLFFDPGREFETARQRREAEAKAICTGCPVRLTCLDYALNTGQVFGIWGGLNEGERRALRRQRRAS